MISPFVKKFNELTDSRFDFIKLAKIDVNVKSKSIDVLIIYPVDKAEVVSINEEEIRLNVLRALKSKARVNVTLKSSKFDFEYCKQLLFEFFKNYPSVVPFVTARNISFDQDSAKVCVFIALDSSVCEYCDERKIDKETEKYLEVFFTDKIEIKFTSVDSNENISDSIEKFSNAAPEYYLTMEGGRIIVPENVEEFIGKKIEDHAIYIEDCTSAQAEQTVVLCGTVANFTEMEKSDGSGKVFFKFNLIDFTSSMPCLIFLNKYTTVETVRQLEDGKTIVVRGQLKEREFRGNKSLSVFVRGISNCVLPENFVKNELVRRVPDHYSKIFPNSYVEQSQSFIFDDADKWKVPPYLENKSYVVYDFETTGLDTKICKITEIGAVKVVNGKIIETFSTLINPCEPLSERVVETTHITDEMLADQPLIEDVLPDFNLFCDGCILVGHNSNEFDYKILTRVAEEQKLRFSSEHEDTMLLAKKYVHDIRNYKLATLAKYYNVVNENAHRALDDAVTTAKIFINLAKLIKMA